MAGVDEEIGARGLLLFAGFIDPHVHEMLSRRMTSQRLAWVLAEGTHATVQLLPA